MSTPLFDALSVRADEGKRRFHMPGHKGKDVFKSPLAGANRLDFTELYGTGNLYDGLYPIADAEALCARAFDAPHAYFLTGGTTQGIYAAVHLAVSPGDKVIMDRGCHKSVYRALALTGANPVYLKSDFIEPYHIASAIGADAVERALSQNPDAKAVVLTCPTYYGVVCDIREISNIVHAYGARLIVDQAHGAHFPFSPGVRCGVSLGADIAVTSMHKTLPALGQAAVLLTSDGFDPCDVRNATSVFGTSSPSYAVMASMDLTREYMQGEGKKRCPALADMLVGLRRRINSTRLMALDLAGGDPLRLCICTAGLNISGYDAAWFLEEECDIVCEMADARNVLFIITPADSDEDISALEAALMRLEREKGAEDALPELKALPEPEVCMSPRQAMYAKCERVALEMSVGRVAASAICPYPPGIPAVAAGEVIDAEHLEYLYLSGFEPQDEVSVIANL